jgi:hypothetical protein
MTFDLFWKYVQQRGGVQHLNNVPPELHRMAVLDEDGVVTETFVCGRLSMENAKSANQVLCVGDVAVGQKYDALTEAFS